MWASHDLAPFPVELGAEHVHGEHVVTRSWLRELGLDSAEEGRDEAWWAFADGTAARRARILGTDAIPPTLERRVLTT